jgi:hypothetical protein
LMLSSVNLMLCLSCCLNGRKWKMHFRRAQMSKIMEWYWKMILNIS